jgi:hypothetical protein
MDTNYTPENAPGLSPAMRETRGQYFWRLLAATATAK